MDRYHFIQVCKVCFLAIVVSFTALLVTGIIYAIDHMLKTM